MLVHLNVGYLYAFCFDIQLHLSWTMFEDDDVQDMYTHAHPAYGNFCNKRANMKHKTVSQSGWLTGRPTDGWLFGKRKVDWIAEKKTMRSIFSSPPHRPCCCCSINAVLVVLSFLFPPDMFVQRVWIDGWLERCIHVAMYGTLWRWWRGCFTHFV